MGVEKLRGRKQFTEVFSQGRRYAVGHVVVVVRPTTGPVRWGLVVGKRVGNAVVRNRLKRRLRQICRTADAAISSGDVIVIARPSAGAADYDGLLRSVLGALRRAHLVTGADMVAGCARAAPSAAGPKAGPR